jgi:hypothetical protein
MDSRTELRLQVGRGKVLIVQYAIQGEHIYVLEVNPRASRTVPFVAKATSVPVAKIAARVMAGEPLARFGLTEPRPQHVAVKEAVLPFAAARHGAAGLCRQPDQGDRAGSSETLRRDREVCW